MRVYRGTAPPPETRKHSGLEPQLVDRPMTTLGLLAGPPARASLDQCRLILWRT